jgi:glycosyltransferase involved in cell wall biosynthesis
MLAHRRVLVDASMATSGGGYTYLVNMIPALAGACPETEFLVIIRTPGLAQIISPIANVEIRVLPQSGLLGRIAFLASQAATLAAAWEADIYLSVAEYAPRGAHCPVVVQLRNANVFTSLDMGWGKYQKFRLGALRRLAILSAKRAARVIFVSQDSANWMGDAARIPLDLRKVVYHGVDLDAWRQAMNSRPRTGKTGILSVSSIYRYKNCVRLVEAYCELARRVPEVPPLTIVGDDQDAKYSGELRRAISRTGELARKINLTGMVPYEEIIAWYRDASLFVFPSYLETFGHPLLEAMASELPVVAADIPVFREIAGEAALYVNPFDKNEMADAMERVLVDQGEARRLSERARECVEAFTWKSAADRLASLLDEVLAER